MASLRQVDDAENPMRSVIGALFGGMSGARSRQEISGEDVLSSFESLGSNCEFGLVQRYFGIEPLGMFRFTSTNVPNLIDALGTKFAAYGRDGDLEIFEGPEKHLFCRSKRFSFTHNTTILAAQADHALILDREYKKVDYLKNRFLADVIEGEKIFVRNGETSTEEIVRLAQVLRQHGPATILWVREAGEGQRFGDVRWYADGIMEGFMDRNVLFANSGFVALRAWLKLCQNAYNLAHGRTANIVEAIERADFSQGLPSVPIRHRTASNEGVVAAQVVRHLKVSAMHAFSVWVWLPSDFDGERVAADFLPIRYGYYDADLSVRERWQLIWASCKPRKRDKEIEMRLLGPGLTGSGFLSADWRLELGPFPTDRSPPAPVASSV